VVVRTRVYAPSGAAEKYRDRGENVTLTHIFNSLLLDDIRNTSFLGGAKKLGNVFRPFLLFLLLILQQSTPSNLLFPALNTRLFCSEVFPSTRHLPNI